METSTYKRGGIYGKGNSYEVQGSNMASVAGDGEGRANNGLERNCVKSVSKKAEKSR